MRLIPELLVAIVRLKKIDTAFELATHSSQRSDSFLDLKGVEFLCQVLVVLAGNSHEPLAWSCRFWCWLGWLLKSVLLGPSAAVV
jgi:hypothetical protein